MLNTAFTRPPGEDVDAWFAQLAEVLLNQAVLKTPQRAYRLLEIEFYYSGPGHNDPFAHGEDLQKTCARWYFHRSGGAYTGGSYKGLDLTFGPEGTVGGILIRSMAHGGKRINGSSLCVDRLLTETGCTSVAELDAALGERRVHEAGGPMWLEPSKHPARALLATARVGLTLKRAHKHPTMPAFLMRPYRFLIEPRLTKGRVQTVIAMHQQGDMAPLIAARTGASSAVVERYLNDYRRGLAAGPLPTRRMTVADLCFAHGVWTREYGVSGAEGSAPVLL